jgi:hypothetical protein
MDESIDTDRRRLSGDVLATFAAAELHAFETREG